MPRRRRWEALRVVLSEIATGERKRKSVALVDLRRAYFCITIAKESFVVLPLGQAGEEHMCGLLRCGTWNAAQNGEEELASTLSKLKLTRGIACPCV